MAWYNIENNEIISNEKFNEVCSKCTTFCCNGDRLSCPNYEEVDTPEYDKEIRNKTIDEFSERMKEEFYFTLLESQEIDRIIKEMKGERGDVV